MTQPAATEPPGKRRGPYAKSATRRVEILQAALSVFAVAGFRAGSLQEIAEKVGLSEPALFYYFPNKAALLAEVLRYRDRQSLETSRLDKDEPVEALRGLVWLLHHYASTPGMVALQSNLSAEAVDASHPANEFLIRRHRWYIDHFTGILQGCQDRGLLRPGVTPAHGAQGILSMMDGLQLHWLIGLGDVNMAEEMRVYLEQLVDVDLAPVRTDSDDNAQSLQPSRF